MMKVPPRLFAFAAVLIGGGVLGAGAVIASVEVNRITSTDAFCTSCHSMQFVAADPHFAQSAHRANAAGVRVTCADCHIPRGNWFVETWTHARSGLRDVIAEKTHDFADPATWQARRARLAEETLAAMRAEDSATCRTCHDAAALAAKGEAGPAAHAALKQGGVTCVDCHAGVAHAPAAKP
jgi:nitrate/TMAO reductase-like tetraheme cytochrome c subunit